MPSSSSPSSSTSSSSSPSSFSSPSQKFDVFLSFKGADTRRHFISFLYKELDRKGIRVFKDDTELERGRPISPELIQAIKDSRFAVVVISQNYAASVWCLEELVQILEYQKKGSLTVVPIFYEVEPSDVRRQIGVVAEHFKKHESRETPTKVQAWRKALTELANIRGECSLKWEDDSKLVDEISDRISKELLPAATSSYCSSLVGIDEHMKRLYQLLDLNTNDDFRLVGIWGRGGVGRSTLARCVYEKLSPHFQSHCFLENVKRLSSQHKSPSRLREEFLSKLQGETSAMKSMNVGPNVIKAKLKSQKTLLVADDVDKIEQLDALAEDFNWFGPGSRVIITTQDKQLLASCGVNLVYEVELLRCYDVRQLFRQVAFKQRDISVGIERSSYWAVNLLAGVLLTMKSYASTLCCGVRLKQNAIYNC